MSWGSLAQMNGQHAPTACPAFSGRQASRSVPLQTASMNTNRTSGGTSSQSRYSPTRVRIVLKMLPNSRCRAHPIHPVLVIGAGIGSAIARRTKAGTATTSSALISALHQPNPRVVPINEHAGDATDRQIHAHGDGDDLDRLAGLVERGA